MINPLSGKIKTVEDLIHILVQMKMDEIFGNNWKKLKHIEHRYNSYFHFWKREFRCRKKVDIYDHIHLREISICVFWRNLMTRLEMRVAWVSRQCFYASHDHMLSVITSKKLSSLKKKDIRDIMSSLAEEKISAL